MKSILVVTAVIALILACSVAFATVGVNDGLSWNSATGGTGYFNGNGTPDNMTDLLSPTGRGWSYEASPVTSYVSYKGAYSGSGIYDYDDYKWLGSLADQASLKVVCDVEMWSTYGVSATEVYFHLGNENAHQMDANLTGTFASNNGQWIGIRKSDWGSGDRAKADNLTFVADGFGRTKAYFVANQPTHVPTDIPIEYYLQVNGGAWTKAQAADWSGGNGGTEYGYWWLVNNGDPGSYNLNWLLRIKPKTFQEDGRYYLDPDLVVMPAM